MANFFVSLHPRQQLLPDCISVYSQMSHFLNVSSWLISIYSVRANYRYTWTLVLYLTALSLVTSWWFLFFYDIEWISLDPISLLHLHVLSPGKSSLDLSRLFFVNEIKLYQILIKLYIALAIAPPNIFGKEIMSQK